MTSKRKKDARLNELSIIMADGNQLAKKASMKLLGNKRYLQFRMALRGRKVDELTKQQRKLIAMIPKRERNTMVAVDGVVDELVDLFQRLLKKIAAKFSEKYGLEKDDLFGQACVYFIQAIYGYDDLTYCFVTYARSVVLKELRRYVLFNRRQHISSQSSDYVNVLRACYKVERELWQKLQRKPRVEEIEEEVRSQFSKLGNKFLLNKVKGVLLKITSPKAVNRKTPNSEEQLSFAEVKECQIDDRAIEAVDHQHDILSYFEQANVDQRDQEILIAKSMGISIADIATKFGLTSKETKSIIAREKYKLKKIA